MLSGLVPVNIVHLSCQFQHQLASLGNWKRNNNLVKYISYFRHISIYTKAINILHTYSLLRSFILRANSTVFIEVTFSGLVLLNIVHLSRQFQHQLASLGHWKKNNNVVKYVIVTTDFFNFHEGK
jgi:hypothetical protein